MGRANVGLAVAVGLIALFATDGLAQPQDKAQQRCINALNRSLERVWSAAAKNVSTCIKWGTSERLPPGVPDIETCISMDVKGKVARAVARALEAEQALCGAAPDFGASTAAALTAAAVSDAEAMFHDTFGADLDATLYTNSAWKDAAACHRSVSNLMGKCASTRLRQFNKCKKAGLRSVGGAPPAVQSGAELSSECLMTSGDPLTGQPDDKAKISRACYSNGAVLDAIVKVLVERCQNNQGVGISVTVPNCPAPNTRSCIRDRIACRICESIVVTDAVPRDCDLFDNGAADGSCPP